MNIKTSVLLANLLVAAQGVAFATEAPTPTSGQLIPKTQTDKLNLRIRHQFLQIHRETKLGKLTKDQAKSLKTQVLAIHEEELSDLKTNGSKVLTDAQLVQLNAELDTLSKSIPIR